MNSYRQRLIYQAQDDYQMGYLTRREVEDIELAMLRDERREQERRDEPRVDEDDERGGRR